MSSSKLKEITGDIWDFWNRGHYIVIPTNGSVKKNGEAVMGKGLALQAKEKISELYEKRVTNCPKCGASMHELPYTRKHGKARFICDSCGYWEDRNVSIESLQKELGSRIKEYGNFVFVFAKFRIITFPVKKEWWFKNADTGLIEKSCLELKEIFRYNLSGIPTPIYLPRVGCGNGRLDWKDVKPVLEKHLDSRFVVCDRRM